MSPFHSTLTRRRLALLVVAAIALPPGGIAHADEDVSMLTAPADVQDIEWTVVSLGEEAVTGDSKVTLTLGADGRYSGRACNGYGGTYTIEPGKVAFGNAAATMMACAEPLMRQEHALFDAFTAAKSFELNGDGQLLLVDADGKTLVTAQR